MPSAIAHLLDALAGGAVEVVDHTQPLRERTPVIRLPPAWAWDVLEPGEHTGSHVDAPAYRITGRDGEDVGSIPVELANLDQLPVTSAVVVVAPLRLDDVAGSPARALIEA